LWGNISNVRTRTGIDKPRWLCVLRSYFGGGRDILVYVIGDKSPGRRPAAKLLTKDEARRIAAYRMPNDAGASYA
jgi:hypothetical protein